MCKATTLLHRVHNVSETYTERPGSRLGSEQRKVKMNRCVSVQLMKGNSPTIPQYWLNLPNVGVDKGFASSLKPYTVQIHIARTDWTAIKGDIN